MAQTKKSEGPAGFLVAPGASADRTNRTMVALDDGLDLPVCRVTIKSRAERKVFAALQADLVEFCSEIGATDDQVLLGGRSFGGRMCSMMVAQGQPAAGLILLSYPLHPPGKPDTLRVDHFGELNLPVLFVSGTRDPFGSEAEIRQHAEAIAGPTSFVFLEGEAHSPKNDEAVVEAVAQWIAGL